MAASRRFTSRVVAHISHVSAPSFADGVELIGQSLDGGRIDAARADGLAVGSHAGENVIGVGSAVVARLWSAGLPAQHGDIVVQADVAGAVVLREQYALGRQGLRKVRSFRVWTEGDVKAFVFENDNKNVLNAAVVVAIPGGTRRFARAGPGERRTCES